MTEILLIDLSSLWWTSYHAVPHDASVSETARATGDALRRTIGMFPDAKVAVCCDQGRSFRKDALPEYKATRPDKDAATLTELARFKDRLRDDGMLLWGVDGFEADDVIATAAHEAAKREMPFIVASADKDLLQLLALPDSRQLRTYGDWATWRAANVVEKFGVEPEMLGDWLALVGDASDNVKGVPSVGPKTATALIVQHGGLEPLYARVEALVMEKDGEKVIVTKTPEAAKVATPAVLDKLWRHKADAMLARQIVTLRTDVPIEFGQLFEHRDPKPSTVSEVDMDSVDDLIVEAKKPDPKESAAPAATSAPTTPVEDSSPAASTPTTATDAPSSPPSSAGASIATMGVATIATAETKALVQHVEVEYEHALEPRTAGQAVTLGQVLYESRAFARFPSPGAITATVMRGRELGIAALASLDAFHFVAELGRILPSWQVIVTLAEQSPDCEWFRWVDGDDKSQTWETKHRKHPTPTKLTYRIDQAERAGLVKPDKPKAAWSARPDEMLRKTAACQLARTVFPGATLGLYAYEEMGGE